MALKAKYQYKSEQVMRDARPWTVRFLDAAKDPQSAVMAYVMAAISMYVHPLTENLSDLTFLCMALYFWWIMTRQVHLPFKLPKSAGIKDPNFKRPDGSLGMADGILYLGNDSDTGEEVWFTNSDARTHCLYLGTTGSGKTFGLKSYACNALTWASGFIYIDGKADTDLWSTLSAQARRLGRDDDLLIMNYMTGNALGRVASNTLNPFSSGSASYITNMLVSLMPESSGDNAMWSGRAIALVAALMPCLVWKRDNQNIPLSIGVIRTYLTFKAVIRLSRDNVLPDLLRAPIRAYLVELPGYVDNVFDDNGDEKPAGPETGNVDTSVPRQQHGYLSMQFTRSMQSLGDDYGFIFDTQAADIDMMDVVLNRRILIVLIPSLEKSEDETANLGKIISTTLKGMMGATLGSTVEGETATAIENKPTNSSTPFIAIFDEVGYYTAQGMAVMAAQARSLGFSLVFAGQDLPAMEKRVKEEARSITANCNIKLFGKLEDPTSTKDFFEKTVGTATVAELSGFQRSQSGSGYTDSPNASLQSRARAGYDGLKGFTEGRAICAFGKSVHEMQVYNSDIGHAKAMRVHRFLPIPPPAEDALESLRQVDSILRRLRNPKWSADAVETKKNKDIEAIVKGFSDSRKAKGGFVECGIMAVAAVAEAHGTINRQTALEGPAPGADGSPPPVSQAAEIAAAGKLASVGAGPLNWMEVIGGADIQAAVPARLDPPVTESVVRQGTAQGAGQMKMAPPAPEPPRPRGAPPPLPPQARPVIDPVAAKAAENAITAALAQEGKGPISWMDIIGADSASLVTSADSASLVTSADSAPLVASADSALLITTTESALPAFIPADIEMIPAAPVVPFLPKTDAEEEKRARDAGVVNPISWMDIIGGSNDEEKKE
jgi:intracellular multiplication protein IcmO